MNSRHSKGARASSSLSWFPSAAVGIGAVAASAFFYRKPLQQLLHRRAPGVVRMYGKVRRKIHATFPCFEWNV